jgi:hypothetical protein
VKELTCILILTKDALSEVGRLLVMASLFEGRRILKLQRSLYPAHTLQHISLKQMFVRAPQDLLKVFSRLLQLVGVQPLILRRCWTEVGKMEVF